jgi:hypothetical protein
MSRDAYTADELAEVADGLRRMLQAIAAGELTADSGTVARLEGAAVAIEALAAGRSPLEVATDLREAGKFA